MAWLPHVDGWNQSIDSDALRLGRGFFFWLRVEPRHKIIPRPLCLDFSFVSSHSDSSIFYVKRPFSSGPEKRQHRANLRFGGPSVEMCCANRRHKKAVCPTSPPHSSYNVLINYLGTPVHPTPPPFSLNHWLSHVRTGPQNLQCGVIWLLCHPQQRSC